MLPANTTSSGVEAPTGSDAVGRLALRFGVGVGVLCSFWLLFLQLTGNNPFGPKQLLGQLFVPFAVVGSQWVLRRTLAPMLPGVGRALAVGGLTALLAALIAAGSVWSLARGVDESVLARNRAEMVEIVRVQQREIPKEKRNAQLEAQQVQRIGEISIRDLALSTFTRVLLLGMVVGLPSGIFFRK
jgi:hypothetical protein